MFGKISAAGCAALLAASASCGGIPGDSFTAPQNAEEAVRAGLAAAEAGQWRSPAERAWVVQALEDDDPATRAAAALALRKSRDASPEIVAALTRALDHPNQDTRSVAATALLALGEDGKKILRARILSAGSLEKRLEALTALRSTLEGLRDASLEDLAASVRREIQKVTAPDPVATSASPLQDGAMETVGGTSDWEFLRDGGGQGNVTWDGQKHRRVGGSLRLEKQNSDGAVSLRSARPLKIPAGQRTTVRLYYHADNAPQDAALQLLFEDRSGHKFLGDFHGGHAVLAQNAVRNSAPGKWVKLVAELPAASEPQEVFLRVQLKGNPSTVWIDDVAAPAPDYRYHYTAPLQTLPEHPANTTNEPDAPFTAQVVPAAHGRARLLVDGQPVPPLIYFSYMNSFGEYAGMEALADIRLQIVAVEMNSSDMRGLYPPTYPVWKDAEKFDFRTPLASLEFAARQAPQSRFLIVFNIYWPNDWVLKNPQEAWRNAAGQRAYGNDTSALMGFGDALPPGTQWWPSPFSKKAQAAAEEGIRKFVTQLKATPWANRVIGCHITGGHDEQFFTECFPDFSEPAVAAFREWLRKRYGNDEALRRAWGDPSLSLDAVGIPDPGQRPPAASRLFYDPATERRYVDHRQFQAEQGMVQKAGFARVFKEAMGRPVIAAADQMGEIRSQGMDTVLQETPGSLDLIAAQPWYERRLPGYSGGIAGSLATLNARGKIGLSELDLRTWLRAGGGEINGMQVGAALSPEDFRAMFRKEAAPMIATGNGYWLFDIGTTHWRDPIMLQTIAEGSRAYRELEINNPAPFQPEVAVVWHDPSIYWMADTIHETLSYWKRFERYTLLGLRASGIPFEEVALTDLLSRDTPLPYKVYVFPNAFALTHAQRKAVADKLQKNGHVLIWNYAAGYVGEDALGDPGTSALTGLCIRSEPVTQIPEVRFTTTADSWGAGLSGIPGLGELNNLLMKTGIDPYSPPIPQGFRRFIVEDPAARPLATYRDGKTALAVKQFPRWTSIFCGMLGTLDARLLRNAAAAAGVPALVNLGVVADFNGQFLSLHGLQNGPVSLSLPSASQIYDFDSGQRLASGQQVSLPLWAGETRWYKIEPIKKSHE